MNAGFAIGAKSATHTSNLRKKKTPFKYTKHTKRICNFSTVAYTMQNTNFLKPVWRIIPCPLEYEAALRADKYGFIHVYKKFQHLMKSEKELFIPFLSPSTVKVYPDICNIKSTIDLNEVKRLMYYNQHVRFAMKKCIRLWRLKRFKFANETDIVTFETPVNPIILYDWTSKYKYVFEASTLYKCITDRLQFAVNMFVKPTEPVNPFTNLPLTLGQVHFLIDELLRRGRSNWILLAFRSSGYSLETLLKHHRQSLQFYTIRREFGITLSESAKVCVSSFRDDRYEDISSYYYVNHIWDWAIETVPNHPDVVPWINLTRRYYMYLSGDSNENRNIIYDDARKLTEGSHRGIIKTWKEMNAAAIKLLKDKLYPHVERNSFSSDINPIIDQIILTYSESEIDELIALTHEETSLYTIVSEWDFANTPLPPPVPTPLLVPPVQNTAASGLLTIDIPIENLIDIMFT